MSEVKRPGEQALEAVRAKKKQKRVDMPPPAPRPAKKTGGAKVLDDDEFEVKLAAIIERDYFPDIQRLQNRLEWTEALDSGDAERITTAQKNIMLRRAGFSVPLNAQAAPTYAPSPTPKRAGTADLSTASNETPSATNLGNTKDIQLPSGAILPPSLDISTFTASHTTEDQESMDSILNAENLKRRVRNSWAYDESARTNAHLLSLGHQPGLLLSSDKKDTSNEKCIEDSSGVTQAAVLAIRSGDRENNGAKASQLQDCVLHNPKSALYYTPSTDLPLSAAERQMMAVGAPPQTIAANTRFAPAQSNAEACDTPATLASTPSILSESPLERENSASVPIGENRVHDGNAHDLGKSSRTWNTSVKQIGGGASMGVVPSPSISSLGNSAPIMTWGEVGATPMVLDEKELFGTDNPLQYEGGGVSSSILTAKRGVKELAADRARKEIASTRLGSKAHTPLHRQSHLGANTMSPAARKCAKMLQGKSLWKQVDTQLRASYGHRTPVGTSSRTELVGTTPIHAPVGSSPATREPVPRGLLGEMTPERHL